LEKERQELTVEITRNLHDVIRESSQFSPTCWLDLDLTAPQVKSLFYIAYQEETNFKNLACALGVTPPSVTGIIDKLVEQGLVSREENPENRRMLILKTTPKGKELISSLKEFRDNNISAMLDRLSMEELRTLLQIVKKLSIRPQVASDPKTHS
jgi:DNA-binding MarR family transcriptional regulator